METQIPFKVRGDKYVAIFATRHPMLSRSVWGRCDWSTRTIAIRRSLKGLHAIDTVAHEFTHAFFPDLAEDSVNEFATQLVALLKDCGMLREDWTAKHLEN